MALGRAATFSLEKLLAEATSQVRAKVSDGGRLSSALLEAEQRLTSTVTARADDLARRLDQSDEERRRLILLLTDDRIQATRASIWKRIFSR